MATVDCCARLRLLLTSLLALFGVYDPVARTFIGTANDTVTTVIGNASSNYIQNLKAATL